MNTEIKYLELLSKTFKNIAETSTEIINLQAIMNLPKGTEHFMTDIHGEYEAFNHVLRNGSGTIRNKIEEAYGNKLTENEKKELASIIYYPKEKVELMQNKDNFNIDRWMITIIYRLIEVCKVVCSKYTRSKVRKAMTKDFEYILQELLYEKKELANKKEYFDSIVDTIISIDRGKEFIIAICNLIQRLNIDHLHIVGDIYDRGPFPHLIMDTLAEYSNLDIQWGNHDILWIGAALGNKACIANVIRICCRYNNNDILEEAYGINLLPFATFAMKYYGDDPCKRFRAKEGVDSDLIAQMHKAMSIIQFKVEGLYSERNPELEMSSRESLKHINYEKGTINLNGVEYPLNDTNFPTVNPENPLELLEEEAELLDKLQASFLGSEKLQKHMQLLFAKGGMYLKYNSNLLFHACIPMEPNGEFSELFVEDGYYKGKALMDKIDNIVRQAYYDRKNVEVNKKHRDFIWYLWAGRLSPLFGKDVMKTFERYFIDDKTTHKEIKNPYHKLINDEKVCDKIFEEFGLNPRTSHIINGHIPVKVKEGESPVKANGKLLIIDGGFSRAYQSTTGIAGYTLTYNSYGMKLASHLKFISKEAAIKDGTDMISSHIIVETKSKRMKVKDTDIGKSIQTQINDLKKLLKAYRIGLIKSN
ncbi:fructose-1,6-bisphosphatase [Fusobacterium nucleatum]|uniref:Fructose-1,6-bisphosphatase class 3 n=2 Tax=Fusobacterium nucleatum subsp. nucleatum (strain ATCC 25586 / DSM 15643 / BCRC 10681 / CIP 101130 / JCM 8532 / KCTC 2640 / LMG 13131 / VPI 4355) TaxID=190304 RepID=F16PC_FUSNN|nr:fructose-1,6-bisphosphatase [Fusobacterium nucleatum]Q8RFB5.1 RecName: Full=Fructose-1,6-bisphosphatase class 3; Short=FBPase class 3; AltName: Full=D-fructose-1,6-bisphosphate 1-phosphohydrolase class 3 [Fusobacterium nucleatum subsp. nucleatum ATCC 25586]AAL94994.1 Fructose-1,6-bisphosphatase [Fusobacterium nucleatum subsp. nucleatum ATCC 25586]ALF24208.1 fructose 1,6-bisphosphatase [Fusobacterium nucleatum subsp. nucleatum ChDC F316]ASG26504.1 fructose 1,6-bisphosphatase [Fusobacterium nu